jgi:hypothetical protein
MSVMVAMSYRKPANASERSKAVFAGKIATVIGSNLRLTRGDGLPPSPLFETFAESGRYHGVNRYGVVFLEKHIYNSEARGSSGPVSISAAEFFLADEARAEQEYGFSTQLRPFQILWRDRDPQRPAATRRGTR